MPPARWAPTALALVAVALAAAAFVQSRPHEPAASRVQVAALDARLAATRADARSRVAALGKRVDGLTASVATEQRGLAPAAAHALRSVVTVETAEGSGTAFSAWKDGDTTYLVTARHVVADSLVHE